MIIEKDWKKIMELVQFIIIHNPHIRLYAYMTIKNTNHDYLAL